MPPMTKSVVDMPAFCAASGSFQVKSSLTSLETVFVLLWRFPFFLTVALIRSSILTVSNLGVRAYTDQRYSLMQFSVKRHSSELRTAVTLAPGSTEVTLAPG